MLKHRSLSATALTFFFLLVGAAHADVAGPWKLAIGASETCTLTLAADGTANGCGTIAKWRTRGDSLALMAGNNDILGVLKVKGDGYVGNRLDDNRKMILSH